MLALLDRSRTRPPTRNGYAGVGSRVQTSLKRRHFIPRGASSSIRYFSITRTIKAQSPPTGSRTRLTIGISVEKISTIL